MDSKEFRNLVEAYSEVYAPQEVDEATAMAKRGYDETKIRNQIAKSTGGGAAADRATKLEKQPTYGDSNKAKQRQNLARAQRGDFRNTTSSSPGLHGYGHKSNDPAVKAKQAARGAQRGALTPAEKKQFNREEFENWVNALVEEGYNLSNYTWDDMYEFYLDEAIYSEKGKAKAAEMIAKRSTPSGRAKSGKGANVAQIRQIRGSGRGRFDREGLGGTPMTPTMAKNPIKKHNYDGTGNKAARRAAALKNEELDIFDAILEFLCVEGYAETLEEAEWIMANELDAADIDAILEGSYEDRIAANNKKYDANRKRAAQRAAARNAARDSGKTGAVPGVGYVTPRRERETYTDSSGKTRHAKGL